MESGTKLLLYILVHAERRVTPVEFIWFNFPLRSDTGVGASPVGKASRVGKQVKSPDVAGPPLTRLLTL